MIEAEDVLLGEAAADVEDAVPEAVFCAVPLWPSAVWRVGSEA
jgi:hypothetical protein